MPKWINKNTKATIVGYIAALMNAAVVIDWDNLDWSLISTWVKVIVGLGLPIVSGHMTEIKSKTNEQI